MNRSAAPSAVATYNRCLDIDQLKSRLRRRWSRIAVVIAFRTDPNAILVLKANGP